MRTLLKKTIKLITGDTPHPANKLKRLSRRDLIRMESKIGAEVFGPIPAGHRREFFCLDPNTWIWYEQWTNANGKQQELTTRYEVHPNGVLKVQDGQPYVMIEGKELENLLLAVKIYRERVMRDVYHRDPATGHKLPASA